MIFPEIPTELIFRINDADFALKKWLIENFPEGTALRWKAGKYKGRLCRLRHACSIRELDGTWTVGLRVETRRLTDLGFINNSDDFHRTYHDSNYFFERYENESGRG